MNLWRRIKRWFYEAPWIEVGSAEVPGFGVRVTVGYSWGTADPPELTVDGVSTPAIVHPGHDRRVWRRKGKGR